MSNSITDSITLDQWLRDGREIAVLDLRDDEDYGYGDPLLGANLPLARLEADIAAYVPNRRARIVLLDGGDGRSARAAVHLSRLGYETVHTLDGGLPAWIASGITTYLHQPARFFTRDVRAASATPHVTAAELHELHQAKADVIVLDSRTVDEYRRNHVPGSVSVPGAELLHRFADLVPSSDTFVLVTCAGLPRAITGAQTLIEAGVPNRVAFLEDGTKAWREAGLDLETGAGRQFAPTTSELARLFGQQHAAALETKANVPRVSADELTDWLAADGGRTTYILDVRTPEEYAAGHVADAISAPGGQLFLSAYKIVAVRGARLLLVDDTGTRAGTTAYWLRRRGWDVSIHATAQPAVRQREARIA
ncbi:thiosulfate sulfurtransferase [Oleomonas cavernae]|uniref:Thiosulfate sulfurtransferase n=1 Tax=Oleomonas cavernae TaxID=2320859 RepID=A0A418W8S7_9PROT|nr:rhodanese-like domain-containing protein [Oleomonas cavernae]RJF86334.1 thiosulfate sulfurtransferase [Oleomonas cavernae]